LKHNGPIYNYFFGDDFIQADLEDPTYEPPVFDSCSDYDISQEFRTAFGTDNIDLIETSCINRGGIWREFKDEMGCYWNPALGSTNCTNVGQIILSDYCEDKLLANWECDNTIAYTGCLCKTGLPDQWQAEPEADPEPEQDPEPEVFTCGVDIAGVCQGTCPVEQTCGLELNQQTGLMDCKCI